MFGVWVRGLGCESWLPRFLCLLLRMRALEEEAGVCVCVLLPLSNLLHAKVRERGGASLQHLYAVVPAVAHDDAPLAVNCNAVGTVELPISTTLAAAKGSNVAAVTVSQNLHPMITVVGYNDVAGTVKRDAAGTVELPCA